MRDYRLAKRHYQSGGSHVQGNPITNALQSQTLHNSNGVSEGVYKQNSFQLRGRSATLSSKPDLIARREEDAAIVNAKTG